MLHCIWDEEAPVGQEGHYQRSRDGLCRAGLGGCRPVKGERRHCSSLDELEPEQ